MLPDEEGFLQPVVDVAKCVRCGKCETACPVLHPGKPRKPLAVYAAKAKDDKLRWGSASGGVFTVLAQDVLKRGGVVFGAGFERPTWRVVHKAATNEEELDDLRGSKYVQSDTGDTFKEAKAYLDAGREVLYSGCPCQIAALKRFLGKDYAKLLTVDLICHGVPSPLAWRKYLDCREEVVGARISSIDSRRFCPWRKYDIAIGFEGDFAAYAEGKDSDPYMRMFLTFGYLRESCYQCSFRNLKSGASISLGDYFLISKRRHDFDDDKGVSSLVVADLVGKAAFRRCEALLNLSEVEYHDAKSDVDSLCKNPRPLRIRRFFYDKLQTHPFDSSVQMAFARRQTSLLMHLLWWCKRLVVNHEINVVRWR